MPNLQFFSQDAKNLPNHPKLMLATIQAIKEFGGKGVAGDIRAFVIEKYQVSEEEQSIPQPSDARSRLEYYLGWGREHLKRSGDLIKCAGNVWVLTEKGHGIETEADAETSLIASRVTIAQETRERNEKKKQGTGSTLGDMLSVAIKAVSPDDDPAPYDVWKSDLLVTLQGIAPDAFERLCQHLLRAKGFINVELSRGGADGGIDGTGILHENLLSRKICFQCKRWQDGDGVGVKEIRDFRGAMDGRAAHGLFITTSHFTDPATKEATRDGAVLIDLIDGDLLCDLLKDNNLGFKTEPDGQKTLTPEWFDRFNTK